MPKTQLTRRLEREGRLFEYGSTLSDPHMDLDQLTSGLNFITSRPRLDILKDYKCVLEYIYSPEHYYDRVIYSGLHLRPEYKYRPGSMRLLKNIKTFLKICGIVGFDKTTKWLYWKALLTIIFKNPKAIEATVNLAAMFIHFHKQSKFIIELTDNEIRCIEKKGADKYDQLIVQDDKKSIAEMVN